MSAWLPAFEDDAVYIWAAFGLTALIVFGFLVFLGVRSQATKHRLEATRRALEARQTAQGDDKSP